MKQSINKFQSAWKPQAGSDVLLLAKDNTGSTPPQLAVEKGHRYLGLNLADYRRQAIPLTGRMHRQLSLSL